MKYSEYLELVKAQLLYEKYICHAANTVFREERCSNDVQEHNKKLHKYVKRLLKKEAAMRRAAGDSCIPAMTLAFVIGRPPASEQISARIALLDKYIAYHKARGD